MPRHVLNGFLLVVLLTLVVFIWATGRDTAQANYNFLPEMLYSVPYDAYATNPIFPDGKTMQLPVPGTLARGEQPLHYQPTPEDALRAGEELTNPFDPGDHAAQLRGARVYGIFCLPCHGASGNGDGPVALRGFPPPASLTSEKVQAMKDGQLFHILTYGQGNMPPYAAQIAPDDRWKVILNIRARHEKAVAAEEPKQASDGEAPPTEEGLP